MVSVIPLPRSQQLLKLTLSSTIILISMPGGRLITLWQWRKVKYGKKKATKSGEGHPLGDRIRRKVHAWVKIISLQYDRLCADLCMVIFPVALMLCLNIPS